MGGDGLILSSTFTDECSNESRRAEISALPLVGCVAGVEQAVGVINSYSKYFCESEAKPSSLMYSLPKSSFIKNLCYYCLLDF